MSSYVFAQLEVKQGSFKEVLGFVNINTDKMYDDNDKPYSVLKVRTENINDKQRRELSFGGDAQTFFEVEYKDGEVWLYCSYYATFIKISHPDLSSTEFYFPFDMQPKKGYEITLVNKPSIDEDLIRRVEKLENAGAPQTSNQVGYITVKSTPKGADVFVDNVKVGVTPYLSESLSIGNHKISVSLDGYEPIAKRVEIEIDKEVNVVFVLEKNQSAIMEETMISTQKTVFSVSPTQKIEFSQGNLQYQASTKTWRFAEHQWDFIGIENKKISSKFNGWIDLFGWGTGNKPTNTSINHNDYNKFYDWGRNIISNGDSRTWRTLTKDEWMYLLETRYTSSRIRYVKAQVNGINGIIIMPDSWIVTTYKFNNPNNKDVSFDSNIVGPNDWLNILEVNGAVFLPAAGRRISKDVMSTNRKGNYWSKADDVFYFSYVSFSNDSFNANDNEYDQCMGYSVRLVCDVE